ncbi:MAG: hypothetical protein QOD90_5011 [Mycobacterium sp.]|jgi:hypothetical protein|nr:hypothetical protein [Mycobacterium sp.]
MISVSGGRECREARLEPVAAAAPVDRWEPVAAVLEVRRGARGASSSIALAAAAVAPVVRAVVLRRALVLVRAALVVDATSSGASDAGSASFGVARLAAAPRYQRTMPINSTVAAVKNINGKRSING